MDNLGKRIYDLRVENSYSQDELANKIGVSRQAISKWEREEGLPDLYNVERLAKVFEISIDELINHQSEEKVNKKDNKASNVLLGITTFVFVVGLILVVFAILFEIIGLVLNLFSVDYLDSISNKYAIIFIISIVVLMYTLRQLYNLFLDKDFEKTRTRLVIILGLMLVAMLILLFTGLVTGFAYIFIYLVMFSVIVVGVVGLVMRKAGQENNHFENYKPHIKLFSKIAIILLISCTGFLILNYAKDYFLVRNIRYVEELYVKQTSGNYTFINIKELENESYTYHFRFSQDLDYNGEDIYIEIYSGDFLLGAGDMTNFGQVYLDDPLLPAVYHYEFDDKKDTPNYTLIVPGLNIDEDDLGDISYKIYYTQDGVDSYMEFDVRFRTLRIEYEYKNIWLWDYNELDTLN